MIPPNNHLFSPFAKVRPSYVWIYYDDEIDGKRDAATAKLTALQHNQQTLAFTVGQLHCNLNRSVLINNDIPSISIG